jgi:hypothetical protein
MRHTTQLTFGLALGIAVAIAPTARAACPATAAVFLLDQSNSMNDAGSTGAPKRDIAQTKMLADYHSLASGTPVGVYGFGNAPQFDPNYTHTYIAVDPVNPKKAVTDDAAIVSAFQTAHDDIIPGTWWTPLAGAACDSIQIDLTNLTDASCLIGSPPPTEYQLYLYSDGLENSTPTTHACAGPSSVGTFVPSLEGSGFGLDVNSWQWHMANTALTGDPNTIAIPPGGIRFVFNVSLLFDTVNSLSGASSGVDGHAVSASGLQQAVTPDLVALMSGLSSVTNGQYFEAKTVNGVATVIPMPGDTDPSPTRSCVDQADVNRVVQALGHRVAPNDPKFSQQDLAMRDVNNDQIVNTADYLLVLKYFGKCSN